MGVWLGAAAAALVKQQHTVARRVKQAAVVWRTTGARPTMQKHRRLALGIAAQLPINLVAVTAVQHASLEGLDRRVEGVVRLGETG